MGPHLEPLVVTVGHPIQQLGPIEPEPREEGHVLRADHDRDRVELEQVEPAHDPAQMAAIDRALGSGVAEALSSQRDPPGLRYGKRPGHPR